MRRNRWWLVVVGIVAVAAIAWVVRARTQPGAAAAKGPPPSRPVPIVAVTAAKRDVPIYLEGLGNVVAFRTATVKSQVDGLLQTVSFREGQAVRRGDLLAQIDPRPFKIQLQQAEGALARDRAQLVAARRNLERYRELAAQKLIPQQQADDQAATVGQLDGAVRMDEAAIQTARLNLDYAAIKSPIDGVTGIRSVDPGNLVRSTDATGIVVVTQLDPIAVLFTLPQDQLTPVARELSRGRLPVEVYSRDGSTLLGKGDLSLVDNQINATTSTIRLKAIVPNPDRVLWPNQFVNARLLLTTRKDALVIPATAVQRGPNGTFVYVVKPDMTAAPQPVEVAATQGDTVILASGVTDGDRVVVDGQNQLRPGSKVAPREPASGKPGNGKPGDGKPAEGRPGDAGPRKEKPARGPDEKSAQGNGAPAR